MTDSKLAKVTLGEVSPAKRRKVTAEDVHKFATLSGDFGKTHVDEEFARTTPYKRCIAHGVLLLAMMGNGPLDDDSIGLNVSYGYDRIRFIRPVFVGDSITTVSTIIEKREERNEVVVEEKLIDGEGKLAAIAHHIYKFI
jgi:acyl dehydratase